MSGEILLIRHAETDLAGTFCGHSNPCVNGSGYQQIELLLEKLTRYAIDVVYTSDLQRALTTAQAIAARCAAVLEIASGLREIHFGRWESLTWQQIEQRDPVYAQRWVDQYPNLPSPDGERFSSFKDRALHAFDTLIAQLHGRTAAIVTHGGVLRILLTHRFGLTDEQAWRRTQPYCSFLPYSLAQVLS